MPAGSGPVRTIVKNLRTKLGEDAENPTYIFNEPRVGYRLGDGETAETETLDHERLRRRHSLKCEEFNPVPSHGQAVVTGAFSNIVRYGVHSLLKSGVAVRTLTRNPTGSTRSSDGCQRLHWTSVTEGSRRSMDRCRVLYNTYGSGSGGGGLPLTRRWKTRRCCSMRCESRRGQDVHFSVANASTDSRLPYFRGKGQVEEILMGMDIPYAIIRPTLVFGEGDLLLNNMAWALRRFPVSPVFGNGDYKVQPIYAEDLAGPGGGGWFRG